MSNLKKFVVCLTVVIATLSMSGCCFLACGDWGHHDHSRGYSGGYDHDDRGHRH